jgi:ligand-binding SRPBCC domain-containing protein
LSRRHTFRSQTFIAAALPDVFAFFSDPANLGRITPPKMRFTITKAPAGALAAGARIDYRIRIFGLPMNWTTLIDTWRENESFSDVQERGPYRYWHHVHTFKAIKGGVEMHDDVTYELPLGWLGELFGGWIVERQVQKIFAYRAAVIQEVFGGG